MATDRVRLPALQPQIISASRNRLQPFPIRPVPASHRCIPLPTGSRRNQLPPFPPGRSSPTVADCHRRCKTHSRCQPRPTAGPPSLMQSATYYNRFHPGQLPPAVAESQPSNLKPGSSKAPSSPPSRRYPRPTEIFQPRIVGKAATDYHPSVSNRSSPVGPRRSRLPLLTPVSRRQPRTTAQHHNIYRWRQQSVSNFFMCWPCFDCHPVHIFFALVYNSGFSIDRTRISGTDRNRIQPFPLVTVSTP